MLPLEIEELLFLESETPAQELILLKFTQERIKMECLEKFSEFLYLLTIFLATPMNHCLYLCVSLEKPQSLV